MKQEFTDTIRAMREAGYMVIVWTPDELGDTNTSHIEDMLIERGNDMIEQFKEEKCITWAH